MKKVFTKIFAVVFIFTLIFSSISIQADEPLYEKYEYQENFEYEDEIIGHALKAAVPKIMLEYSARVRYRPMKVDVDSLAEQVNIWSQQLAEAGYSEEDISEILVKDGETVTLEALQEKRLAPKGTGRVKILARGIMTKKLDIIADSFSLQAVKMITLAGGRAEQYK